MKNYTVAVLVALLGLVGGCGGDESGYLAGSGCVEVSVEGSWNSMAAEWRCRDATYGALCSIEHAPNGVNISCRCHKTTFSTDDYEYKKETVYIKGDWNDNAPADDPSIFPSYVQSIPACDWWTPPF